jgi:hypothetical protein
MCGSGIGYAMTRTMSCRGPKHLTNRWECQGEEIRKCSPVRTRLRVAMAPLLIAGAVATALVVASSTTSAPVTEKLCTSGDGKRPHDGHQREHNDRSSRAGPAGRCADPSEYVLASVRCALPEPNRTLRRPARLEGLTVHVRGRRSPRRLSIGLQINGGPALGARAVAGDSRRLALCADGCVAGELVGCPRTACLRADGQDRRCAGTLRAPDVLRPGGRMLTVLGLVGVAAGMGISVGSVVKLWIDSRKQGNND